jgi:hypothetical protein
MFTKYGMDEQIKGYDIMGTYGTLERERERYENSLQYFSLAF